MHNKKASQATGYGFVGRQQVILDSDKIGHRVITSYYIYSCLVVPTSYSGCSCFHDTTLAKWRLLFYRSKLISSTPSAMHKNNTTNLHLF